MVSVWPARQYIVGLIVKFITVGFIVKDLLSYFCKHSISPMTVEEIPGQYLSLKAFKITKFALRYIHPPIYFKLPLNCNVNATVVILFSSESNCKNNMLSAFTHFFFSINFTTGLVLLKWSPQIWRSDYNSYIWCMEWWFKRAAMFHCDFKLHPKAFLFIQENFTNISFLPRILFCGLHSECPKPHLHISSTLNSLYL